jgi:hypothetical protein
LAGPPLEDRPAGECGQGGEDALAAHNPEHVEAAEGVERVEAGSGGNGHWVWSDFITGGGSGDGRITMYEKETEY